MGYLDRYLQDPRALELMKEERRLENELRRVREALSALWAEITSDMPSYP